MPHSTQPSQPSQPSLSLLDRFLPVWILAAMAAGLFIGSTFPGVKEVLDSFEVGNVSIPIAIGLLIMMFPPLAKVRFDQTKKIATDRRLMAVSLTLNWLVGPGSSSPTPPRCALV